jgi:hypothetical protein
MSWFTWLQLAWAAAVVAVLAERALILLYRLPPGEAGLALVTERLRSRDLRAARAWAEERPDTLLGQLLGRYFTPMPWADTPEPAILLADLTERVHARLLWLRVGATLSSTLGLLGGVLAIARGLGPAQGLVGLQQGLAERLAMDQALTSMAIGVGTAAVCFYGLSRLRPAARQLVAQARTLSHLLPVEARGPAREQEQATGGDT